MKAFGSRVNEGEGEGEGDSPFFCAAPTRGVPTVIGDWSDRAARNRPSRGRLEVAPPGKEHGARETRPSQSARETRRSKRRPEGRRSQSAPRTTPLRTTPLLPGVRHWKFQRKRRRGDRKVPPPDPARNWAGIVHQRRPPRCRCRTTRRGDPCGRPPLNGATVRRPLPGHYRTGGGWSGDFLVADRDRRVSRADWDRRPSGRREWRRRAATHQGTMRLRRAPTRGAPTVIGELVRQGG